MERASVHKAKPAPSATGSASSWFAGTQRFGVLQRRSDEQSKPASVPPIVHNVLRSPGEPLDAATRACMEPRFGHDFSKVRVHADAEAAESARAVNALAYTVGRNVVFGARQYHPDTTAGKGLLAHELVHTVQQGTGYGPTLTINQPGDRYEQQAGLMEAAIARGEKPSSHDLRGAGDARQLMRQHAGEPKKTGERDSDPGATPHIPYLLPKVAITNLPPWAPPSVKQASTSTTGISGVDNAVAKLNHAVDRTAACDITFVKVQTPEEILQCTRVLNAQANSFLNQSLLVPPRNEYMLSSPETDAKNENMKAQEILKKQFGEFWGAFFWHVRGGGQTGEDAPIWQAMSLAASVNKAYPIPRYRTAPRVYPDRLPFIPQTESTK